VSDPDGLVATPVETVPRGRGDVARLAALVLEHEVLEVVVGLPRHLRGGEGASAADARGFAQRLADRLAPVPVRLVDERLSTVSAERSLRAAGVSGARGRRERKGVVDQAAAVVVLQLALDTERGSGRVPGTPVPRAVSNRLEAGRDDMPGAADGDPDGPAPSGRVSP
jgi:putative Holliday junction resolvase